MLPSVSVSMLAKMEAGRELKEFGLRELIRSGRPAAAVEWLLERGLVIEAIEICRGSAIKRGLSRSFYIQSSSNRSQDKS